MSRRSSDTVSQSVDEQVLLVDVGNANTVFGLLRGGVLGEPLRLATDRSRTADEFGALLLPLTRRIGLEPDAVEALVVSSVVPPLNPVVRSLAEDYFGCRAIFVEPGVRTGMPIRHDHPGEVGADRIVNAVAAREHYGAPVVVVDFGTATVFDVVDPGGAYIGGIIAPGIAISAEALFAQASKLFRVDLHRPPQLIGRNTQAAMQSGIYYGALGLVDGILSRLHAEIEGLERVVSTGGQAGLIAEASEQITDIDTLLTLKGLELIYRRNRATWRR
ncbi:MAG: type III pantothenate kinase [Acidobacteriota bacterium]